MDQGPGAPYNAAAKFYAVYSGDSALDHDVRVSRLIDRHVHFGKTSDAARAWSLGPDEANALLVGATADRADHRIRLP